MKFSLFVLSFLLALCWSCDAQKEKNTSYKPNSTGPINLVSVFSNEDLYKSIEPALQDTLVFGRIFPGLYYPPEISFATRHFNTDLLRDFSNTRLILHLKKGKAQLHFEEDKFAKPQAYVEVQGENENEIIQLLQQHQDSLLDFYARADQRFVLKNTKTHPAGTLKELDDIGVNILLPKRFELVEANKNFAWYKKEKVNTIQNKDAKGGIATHQSQDLLNVLVYTLPFSKDSLTRKDAIAIRDSIGKLYIKGEKKPEKKNNNGQILTIADYEQTEKHPVLMDFYDFRMLFDSKKETVYSAQGNWSMTLSQLGGPYTMRLILDKENKQLYVADAFIFAPFNQGKSKKRDYLTQLESLFSTFEIVKNK